MAGPMAGTAAREGTGDASVAVPSPITSSTKRDASNPWASAALKSSPTADNSSTNPKQCSTSGGGGGGGAMQTLADIMAEEEAKSAAEKVEKEMETEEERMIRQAMEASLLDASPAAAHTMDSSLLPETKTSAAGDDGLDEDMRRAIALSLQESTAADSSAVTDLATDPAVTTVAAAAAAAANTEDEQMNVSETEAEAIARAIQEADDAEAAASLKLAMELQQEEEETSKRHAASAKASRQPRGNVTTMDHDDFLYEQTGNDGYEGEEREERQLWGADDYDKYQEEHGAYEKYQQQYGSISLADNDDDGFRINAATPSKAWSRLSRNVIVGPNNEIRTKHDVKLKAQSNATRLLGAHANGCRKGGRDVDGPIGISDQAYNSLKQNIKKRGTVKGVERHGHGKAENYGGGKTRGGAMDGNVRLVVTRAINAGLIDGCNGVVKEGKEAIVYHANAGKGILDEKGSVVGGSDGMDVAVKVFKRIQEFRGRRAYVDGDPRYYSTKFKNVDPRKQVELWTEKEYRNLIRANKAGVPVPSPLMQKENVLFMRFLGEEGWPSPQLREVDMRKGSKKWTTLYEQVMVAVRRLYHCARLVHGDLSEVSFAVIVSFTPKDALRACAQFGLSPTPAHICSTKYNVLLFSPVPRTTDSPVQYIALSIALIENHGIWERKGETESGDDDLEIVLIDLGQAVERQHPSSEELLVRDLAMVREFFIKQGIHVLNEKDALDFVTAPCEYGKNGEDLEAAEDSENGDIECATIGDRNKDASAHECHNDDFADDGAGDDQSVWRFTIPGWDDAADLERLKGRLKATEVAK
eukprot:CAMPEP_0178729992 /NCGR_PEP_ID=MMETSP0699-20121125/29275_1 /TAXON_ID=265572 /ORGANISM="Extubocellulus spinifer, Strain CCMP396" /LENGTH=811 /DNA_ID=CAMNT_0020381975 /DNA_START=55 /DNA_END=2491 /DNA_ORIENTATION=+